MKKNWDETIVLVDKNELFDFSFSIMSKEYYKKKIIDLRASMQKEKEAKKRDNESYTRLIKGVSSPSSKASYRKNKVDKAAYHDRQIENYKRQIESAKDSMKRCK